MGRKISLPILLLLVFALVAYPFMADAKKPLKPKPPKANGAGNFETEEVNNRCGGHSGNSSIGHLYLYEQDPDSGGIVQEGAWGKMRYTVIGPTFKFVFNGHRLVPGAAYTLLYLPEPLPGQGLICLGSGTANRGGNVHIMNMQDGVDTCDLPAEFDANYPDGALIMLVLSADVDCENAMIGWNPTEYLFGCDLITFYDIDGCGETGPDTVENFIDIEKATNGEDADQPGGPIVLVGDPVEWTYVVTNTSDVLLSNVAVTDDQGVEVSCPLTQLAPGESMTCVASGIAEEGQYTNIGTVVATTPDASEVTDFDPSHYYGAPFMIDEANLLYPFVIVDHTIGALNPTENITGHVWIDGLTDLAGPITGLSGQVGYGPDGSDPDGNPEWKWFDAVFGMDWGIEDEYVGQLVPEAVGTYDYAYRFTSTAGLMWVYADLDGTSNGYDPAQAGELTVVASSDILPPASPANLIISGTSADSISLGWDATPDLDVYRYEVFRGDTTGGPYSKHADVLAPATAYIDTAVMIGVSYYYVVVATDTSFNKSVYSNEVEASVTP